ncbi:helix-turn-helix transcriptional regulator [Streptomyces sp. ISL-22]|uniref:helix-turn-helix transcriptional regulator n=1 Tax=unclassified Streptomyces TaxID=2593676 RepID=UPI001BE8BB98|nr:MULTISPECIES: helix-turn-helix transcriptional regulator [unclassified Streptomyces]MBT2416931.1 helix-turn-helix transcriptional regulator [Streptomyces sp. ISL-24]MBT2436929.1 helix-turn-helix transcriptional regulator [Streptomyces sp. ISL-22]
MTEAHPHPDKELCEAGLKLYERALHDGRLRAEDAAPAPCLADLGLLQPTAEDLDWLEPVAPAVVLHRLLRASEDRIADERRREQLLADTFEPLMRIDGRRTAASDNPAITVLSGTRRINEAITEAMTGASQELLSIQPTTHHGGGRVENAQALALDRDQALLDRGGRIRTLYQHTQRYRPLVMARYEQLRGDAEARTLDEVTDRLIVLDRTVAFIPGNKDRTLALEIRHPALIGYLVTTFDRLWRLATPMYPQAVQQPTLNGVTPRQRAIASLLIEGHTDASIADRLGMNIRTVRVHIAKLAVTLGSESRAQLGYLIGQSGILDQADQDS